MSESKDPNPLIARVGALMKQQQEESLRAVFVPDYAESKYLPSEGEPFLQKPYTPELLVGRVHELMDSIAPKDGDPRPRG